MSALGIGVVALSFVPAFVGAALGFLDRDTPIPASQSFDAVRADVLETVQPAHASVWLRERAP